MNWTLIVGEALIVISLFLALATGLVHVCVGHLSKTHFILMLAVTATAIITVSFQMIWLPLLGLFIFINLVVLTQWLLGRWNLIDLEENYKQTPEYRFYFNSNVGYDVKFMQMLTGTGWLLRLFRIQFWAIFVGLQLVAFYLILLKGKP